MCSYICAFNLCESLACQYLSCGACDKCNFLNYFGVESVFQILYFEILRRIVHNTVWYIFINFSRLTCFFAGAMLV